MRQKSFQRQSTTPRCQINESTPLSFLDCKEVLLCIMGPSGLWNPIQMLRNVIPTSWLGLILFALTKVYCKIQHYGAKWFIS